MTIVVLISAAFIAAGAAIALVRAERGPSMLDRTVALEILTSALVGAVALEVALSKRVDAVPILVVLALVGFIGSTTIARFAAVEPKGEGRVLTREEIAALETERIAEERADLGAQDEEHHGGGAEGEVRT